VGGRGARRRGGGGGGAWSSLSGGLALRGSAGAVVELAGCAGRWVHVEIRTSVGEVYS